MAGLLIGGGGGGGLPNPGQCLAGLENVPNLLSIFK